MNTEVDIVDLPYRPAKAKLTVEHVAALLQKNYTQAQIAKLSNVSNQAISQFIDRHWEVLQPLMDNTDLVLAMRLKKRAVEIVNAIEDSDIKKASLMQKATSAGILIDKHRLLSGQSTEKIEIDRALQAIHSNLFNVTPEPKQIEASKPQGRGRRKA